MSTLGVLRGRAGGVDRSADGAAPGAAAAPGGDARGISQWTGGPALGTKVCTVVLWSLLAAGPMGLGAGLMALSSAGSARPVTQSAAAGPAAGEQVVAGEFAERVVLTWLSATAGQEKQLSALVGAVSWTAPKKAYTAANVTVASAHQVGSVWSVVVAADVSAEGQVPVRRFYQVPVSIQEQAGEGRAVTALTLPAPVAGPSVVAAGRSAYARPVPGDGAVAETVSQFLGAYLAGSGDVSRYVSPAAPTAIVAVTPAAYASVDVQDISAATDVDPAAVPSEGAQLKVLVSAEAITSPDQSSAVVYALTLQARAGRWEVFGIDAAPQAAPAGSASSAAAVGASPSATSPAPAATSGS